MTTMPIPGAESARRPREMRTKGQSARQSVTPAQIPPYCTNCGHDLTRHRGGRCWTGSMGEPLARTRSLIACLCDGVVAS